eukprot:SAG25_NODE_4035_length_904_cov_1.322981_1_plen_92_part_10
MKRLLHERRPDLAQAVERLAVPLELLCSKWLLCMFGVSLPRPTVSLTTTTTMMIMMMGAAEIACSNKEQWGWERSAGGLEGTVSDHGGWFSR